VASFQLLCGDHQNTSRARQPFELIGIECLRTDEIRGLASSRESSNGVTVLGGQRSTVTETKLEELKNELAGLMNLRRPQLLEQWRRVYGSDPPEQISRQLLAQAVAYRLQVKALGGINFSTRRALEKITKQKNSKTTENGDDRAKPGIVLVRVWHGETHQVSTLSEGVEYRGRFYRSLSEVARQITGTRWSGPRFFGLTAARRDRATG
jgi:hypothetical protein